MTRALTIVTCAVAVLLAGTGLADTTSCRKKTASKAASMYLVTAKQFNKCSKLIASGKACSEAVRDAIIQSKLAKTRLTITTACAGFSTPFGYASGGDMAIALAGTAAGEGRQATDSVYGRTATVLPADDVTCAKTLAVKAGKAAKTMIKTLIKCGASCDAADQQKVADAFAKATLSIDKRCSAASLTALVGGDLNAHLTTIGDGAQRVIDAMNGSVVPGVSVVTPTPGQIITPPALPAEVSVSARATSVPHAGYVNSIEVNGQDAAYNEVSGDFDAVVSLATPASSEAIFVEARTTFGTKATTVNVNFNLGSLAPAVVITSPPSGTVTSGSSITIDGQVIGDLAQADILLVGGTPTSFNPGTGDFSTSVPLTTDPVQIIEAEVQSIGLGTSDTDTVVILIGTSLPLSQRVPDALFNRLNNSGFDAVGGLIQSELDGALDPSQFIGTPAAGGTICGFSTGATSSTVGGVGADTAQATISIDSFHVDVCDVDAVIGTCDATYDANNVTVTIQADLQGQLQASVTNTSVIFTGSSADLTGGIFCDFVNLFLANLESDFEAELSSVFSTEIPSAINGVLAGINISGPIGEELDVEIDSLYTDIPEDSNGVSFILDSNVTALSPVPDAPNITETVVPTSAGPPVLDQFVPGGSTPYDLGFCLSDGFVNRAMAAFMLQGQFNQSLTEIPVGGIPVPLTTALLGAITGDSAYGAACAGCPVTLVLKPTSAPISREPQPAEDGSVVLIVPNYRLDAIADDSGSPVPLVTGSVTFDLPVTLDVQASTITPTVGTLAVSNTKITANPIGADEVALAAVIDQLFPLAASALGGLFGQIPLPPFEGLTISGVDSAYNVSCTGIYMALQ